MMQTNPQQVGMDPLDLQDVLCKDELPAIVAGWLLDNGRQGSQAPTIVEDMMPSADPKQSPMPFVYVYIDEGEDTDFSAETTLGIIVGTYSQDPDGWRDCKNLAFTIRRKLLEKRFAGNKYRLLLPLKYKGVRQLLAEERTFPTHYFQLTTVWQMALILPPMPAV